MKSLNYDYYIFFVSLISHIFDFINLKKAQTMKVEIGLPLNTALIGLLAWLYGPYLVR